MACRDQPGKHLACICLRESHWRRFWLASCPPRCKTGSDDCLALRVTPRYCQVLTLAMRAVSSPSGRAAELFAEANNWKAYVCVRSMPVLMSSLYLQLLEGRIPIGGVINFWSPWPGESCRRRWRSAYVFPLTEVGLYPPPMIT